MNVSEVVKRMFVDSGLHVTDHFKYSEFFKSDKANKSKVDNVPHTFEQLITICKNIYRCSLVLEELRKIIKLPIIITSGFRCSRLNELVKGGIGSYHLKGAACDITCNDFYKLVEACSFYFDESPIVKYWYFDEEKKYIHFELRCPEK